MKKNDPNAHPSITKNSAFILILSLVVALASCESNKAPHYDTVKSGHNTEDMVRSETVPGYNEFVVKDMYTTDIASTYTIGNEYAVSVAHIYDVFDTEDGKVVAFRAHDAENTVFHLLLPDDMYPSVKDAKSLSVAFRYDGVEVMENYYHSSAYGKFEGDTRADKLVMRTETRSEIGRIITGKITKIEE